MFCGQNTTKKNGKINGVQRYKCHHCQRSFLASKRLNSAQIWHDFSQGKQTYKQLAERHQCSIRTIQRHLKKAPMTQPKPMPRKVNLVMDVTHFKRRFALLVLLDSITQKVVYFRFIDYEKLAYYHVAINEMLEKSFIIQSITCDGKRGLLNAYPNIPTQMCQFHQVAIMTRNLTRKPKSPAAIALRHLVLGLKNSGKSAFKTALNQWFLTYQDYLAERSETDPKRYKHRRLRSTYHSLKRHLDALFCFEEYASLNIEKTTNRLEGLFSEMKRLLSAHNGLTDENKMLFIKDFLSRKM